MTRRNTWKRLREGLEGPTVTVQLPREWAEELLSSLMTSLEMDDGAEQDPDIDLDMDDDMGDGGDMDPSMGEPSDMDSDDDFGGGGFSAGEDDEPDFAAGDIGGDDDGDDEPPAPKAKKPPAKSKDKGKSKKDEPKKDDDGDDENDDVDEGFLDGDKEINQYSSNAPGRGAPSQWSVGQPDARGIAGGKDRSVTGMGMDVRRSAGQQGYSSRIDPKTGKRLESNDVRPQTALGESSFAKLAGMLARSPKTIRRR